MIELNKNCGCRSTTYLISRGTGSLKAVAVEVAEEHTLWTVLHEPFVGRNLFVKNSDGRFRTAMALMQLTGIHHT